MSKAHMTLLDVVASTKELRNRVQGARLSNIYSASSSTYLLRLETNDQQRVWIVLESGVRIHSTKYNLPHTDLPNSFAAKLRKHLKGLRIATLHTAGYDRVVVFCFRSVAKDVSFFLVAELYAKGNIYLLDQEYKILILLHPEDAAERKVGGIYPLKSKYKPFPFEVGKEKLLEDALNPNSNALEEKDDDDEGKNEGDSNAVGSAEANQQIPVDRILAKAGFPKALAKNLLRSNGFKIDKKNPPPLYPSDQISYDLVCSILNQGIEMIRSVCQDSLPGWLTKDLKSKNSGKNQKVDEQVPKAEKERYIDFSPFCFENSGNMTNLEQKSSFNDALDEYFINIDQHKLEVGKAKQEKQVTSRVDRIKEDHQQRLQKFKEVQNQKEIEAQAIEYNLDLVDGVCDRINLELAKGTSWIDIEALLKSEDAVEDPYLECIDTLNLAENQVTIRLFHEDLADDVNVAIDLGKTAYANASDLYNVKKKALDKAKRTEEATEMALKRAHQKGEREKKRAVVKASVGSSQAKNLLSKRRKKFWFEKFYWFVSSDGILVLGGRDAQQNEKLVKHYLKESDVYVHADIHGASSVIVKSSHGKPIPERTLIEAGHLSLCRSSAWDAKLITSAYWVNPDQVSKSAPTGLYLGTGSFMIRGKKNYLPPASLVMGLSIVFRIDVASIERRKQLLLELNETESSEVLENPHQKNNQVAEAHVIDLPNEQKESASNQEIIQDKEPEKISEEPKPPVFSNVDVTSQFLFSSSSFLLSSHDQETESKDFLEDESKSENIDINKSGKKRISKKDRKMMKKGHSEDKEKKDIPKPPESIRNVDKSEKPVDTSKVVRGKRTKLKKIAEKYKDQDEEERILRCQLMGTVPLNDDGKVILPEEDDGDVKDDEEEKDKDSDDEIKNCFYCGATTHIVRNCPDLEGKDSAFINRLIKEHRKKESETFSATIADEMAASAELEAEMKASMDIVPCLVGDPKKEDVIVSAFAMCAPYSALSNYDFKVKLVPGQQKIGQIVKTALNQFTSSIGKAMEKTPETTNLSILDHIRRVPYDDIHLCMIGNCQIAEDLTQKKGAKKKL
jgi:predicted ribosome quality control (RQC) complex YloA/Tae2 family protein